MKKITKLTPELVERIKAKGIDLSDIPELTEAQAKDLYPRNWKPVKKAITIRIDMDNLEWLQSKGKKGYQGRLNEVLRWARLRGCPFV